MKADLLIQDEGIIFGIATIKTGTTPLSWAMQELAYNVGEKGYKN